MNHLLRYFDPVTSATENAVLEHFGWRRIEQNEEGKRRVACMTPFDSTNERNNVSHSIFEDESRPSKLSGTIFFMPHCPFRLYSNVLWANWAPEYLIDCLVVGNSFSAYDNRMVRPLMSQLNRSTTQVTISPLF